MRRKLLRQAAQSLRGLPSMTSALEGGGGSGKVAKSIDKLRDHVQGVSQLVCQL